MKAVRCAGVKGDGGRITSFRLGRITWIASNLPRDTLVREETRR
jgi:hypothetical protein